MTNVAHIQMQPMLSELFEWAMYIIMHSIIMFYSLINCIARLKLCLQYCAKLTLQPILLPVPALFDNKKSEQVILTTGNLQLSFPHYPFLIASNHEDIGSQRRIILFISQSI